MESDKIVEGKIKHDGIFDFKELYNFLYSWLLENQYDVEEKTYTEKIKPEGKELEVIWEATRKISDYFKFKLKIRIYCPMMASAEAVRGNVKIKMNKGQIEVGISSFLEKDYEHRWEATAILKFLRGVYDRYIIKGRIEMYEGKLIGEFNEFIAQVKAFLALTGRP